MSRITDYILEQEALGNLEYVEGKGYVGKGTPEPLVDTFNEADEFIKEREAWIVEQFELSLEEEK